MGRQKIINPLGQKPAFGWFDNISPGLTISSNIMGRYREVISCKGCPGIFSSILKHLAQNKECKNHYLDGEINRLRKSSRKRTLLDQAYKQTNEYEKEKRAIRELSREKENYCRKVQERQTEAA